MKNNKHLFNGLLSVVTLLLTLENYHCGIGKKMSPVYAAGARSNRLTMLRTKIDACSSQTLTAHLCFKENKHWEVPTALGIHLQSWLDYPLEIFTGDLKSKKRRYFLILFMKGKILAERILYPPTECCTFSFDCWVVWTDWKYSTITVTV